MASIVVIGAGQFGSALTIPLIDNGHDVHLVGSFLESEQIDALQATGHHAALGCDLPESLHLHSDAELEAALDQAGLVIVAVHSLGMDWASMVLGFALPPGTPVVVASRGMTGDDDLLRPLAQSLQAQLLESTPVITLAGPLLARELAARRPAAALLAGSPNADLPTVAQWLHGDALSVTVSNDWPGVSVSSALVNLYALVIGMGQSTSHRADLFARSLIEMSYLVGELGGDPETVLGPAGAGDLFATVNQSHPVGRHRALAKHLQSGLRYADAAKQMPGVTLEGAELALAIGATVERQVRAGQLEATRIPLLRTAIDIVCNDGVMENGS